LDHMAKSLLDGETSHGRGKKRRRELSTSSESSSSGSEESRSPEVKRGTLMEALMESKETKEHESSLNKSKKLRKKKKSDDGMSVKVEGNEEGKEPSATSPKQPILQPATVAGAATEELDLTLTEADLHEMYETDDEEEAEDMRLRHEAQRVRRVERRTVEWEGARGMDHEMALRRFEKEVRGDIRRKREGQTEVPTVDTPSLHAGCKCARSSSTVDSASSSSASEGEASDDSDDAIKMAQKDRRRKASIRKRNKRRKAKRDDLAHSLVKQEVDWRRCHPSALSSEIVFNVADMLNESPACRCSSQRRSEGMRHNHYMGEERMKSTVDSCRVSSLHHYILNVRPNPSMQLKRPSTMEIQREGSPPLLFHLDGFSLLSHRPIPSVLPPEPQVKWTDEYRFALEEDEPLSDETVGSLRAVDSLTSFILDEVLELFDVRRWPEEVEKERRMRRQRDVYCSREEEERSDGCPIFHVLPRFVRVREDGSRELAPISAVLDHIRSAYNQSFCTKEQSSRLHSDTRLFEEFTDAEKDGVVINARKRPSCLRVDSIDRSEYLKGDGSEGDGRPVITHMAWRPTLFILAARPDYQIAAAKLAEMKEELQASGDALNADEERVQRAKISAAENHLQKLKNECTARREVPVSLSSKHFRRTGFRADLTQHTILLVMAMNHVRFHWALEKLEERIQYSFKDRTLIELALTHPSYNANYGTNPDHARNAINLCGLRHCGQKVKQYFDGPKLQHEILDLKRGRNRKKGIDRLVELMESMPGVKKMKINPGTINERLEFLGDSVVEMIVTVHLFFLLPDHDEGALATFRSALVQNKNLAALAQEIYLDKLMLLSHGVELLHEPEYRHATANSFEAFMAAVYLDSGKNIDHCERIYGDAMFGKEPEMLKIWTELKDHELKSDYPESDRFLIPKAEVLQKLVEFEDSIGLKFEHIRVLARAFTRSSGTVNNLTKGDHQSLELLGDTILQMATTDFLYQRFPLLHEGHLSLLRTCLVSNKTQAVVCDDLQMTDYVVNITARRHQNKTFKTKDKADLVESLLGAIYVDRGWGYCKAFTKVCFFPRMKFFIDSHAWSDPKSALQQLCLALPRSLACSGERGHRLMPEYRVVAEHGPTNTREYRVACHFRGKKISEGVSNTVHNAQMKAAMEGMQNLPTFFPDEWAKHEQKLLRQRGGGRKGDGEMRDQSGGRRARKRLAGGGGEKQSTSTSHHSTPTPLLAPPSLSCHQPPFSHANPPHPPAHLHFRPPHHSGPSPMAYHQLPPPKPMDLLSMSLAPPPGFLRPEVEPAPPPNQLSPVVPEPPPPGDGEEPGPASIAAPQKTREGKKGREGRRERKRKREEKNVASQPSASIDGSSARRPTTPKDQRSTDVVPPPPPPEGYPPPPPPTAPYSSNSHHRGLSSLKQTRRGDPSRPSFSTNHQQYPHRPPLHHSFPGPSTSRVPKHPMAYQNPNPPPIQNPQSKPKSLLDLSFQDIWGR
ncbi:hypothetical protein PFISCL1PPCAC_21042, partial [Pristionchus fissidentatus]